MTRPRRALVDSLAALALAGAIALAFGHAFLNYDTFFALVWGGEVLDGRRPSYDLPYAPTPHPLALAVGALVSPLNDRAEQVLVAVSVIGLGAFAVGLFRLGQTLFAWPVGLLGAGIALTRVPYLSYGIRGYVDLPALALVTWAAVLEARRPRRGAPVLVLLALAGLLRPEAWLLAAAYWLWVAPRVNGRARVGLAGLAVAAPLLWALADLAATGNPVWSFAGTSTNAARLERPTGLSAVPGVLPFRLGEILRLPELIAAVVGLAGGLALLDARRMALPVAVAGMNGAVYLAFAVAGLPLLGRYLFAAAAMLCLLAALGALGWLTLPRGHPRRKAARVVGVVVLVVLALFAPVQAGRLAFLHEDIARRDVVQADLRELVRSPAATAALRDCRPLYPPTHRPVPMLAWWTGLRPGEVRSTGLEAPRPGGLYVEPLDLERARLSTLDPRDPTPAGTAPPGWTEIERNRSWRMLAGCDVRPRGATDSATG